MLTITAPSFADFAALSSVKALRDHRDAQTLGAALHEVLGRCPGLPLPGRGDTLGRWRTLQSVALLDLALAKIAEPHWDALAIMDDCMPGGAVAVLQALDADAAGCGYSERSTAGSHRPVAFLAPTNLADASLSAIWAVWAAEPPDARVTGVALPVADPNSPRTVQLSGRKAWCSGAAFATHALMTYWDEEDRPCLAAVDMAHPGVKVTTEGWHAVGMDATASVDVVLEKVTGCAVGAPSAYLSRPGFWHGGMGVAACWAGGALALGERVAQGVTARRDPHALAHLGAIDVALGQLMSAMRATALWVDLFPSADAQAMAMRLRCAAEQCAMTVLEHAGRALGPGPLCREASTARLFADLPVFIRQSHAERDLAVLGTLIAEPQRSGERGGWVL